MNRATKPAPWLRAWNELWASFGRQSVKRYVGEDSAGNQYYEFAAGTRSGNVQRGYDPPPNVEKPKEPSVEWRAWLNKSRRFPPSDEEIMLNMRKQQAQLEQDAETERRAPTIDSKGIGAADMNKRDKWSTEYPRYGEEFEPNPGARKPADMDKDERKK